MQALLGCTTSWIYSVSDDSAIRLFYQPGARKAREPAGPKIALRFSRLSVCLFVCASVLIMCANITSCVTMQLQSTTAFGGLQAKIQQASTCIDLCCLDSEKSGRQA